jgi:uncharacterized membrane protein
MLIVTTKFTAFWQRLRSTFWFVPAIMVCMTILLAIVMVNIDQRFSYELQEALIWLRTTSPDGARSLLSAVAGSMISVAGVTFSITMVALSQTSAQYGPRLLSTFMRDRGNQVVLGTFVSTFIYCLLILRTIRSVEEAAFVPQLSVALAVVFAVLSVGVLVYFFHHIARSLQVETIIHNIGHELETSVKRLVDDESSDRPYEHTLRDEADIPDQIDEDATSVISDKSGYIQTIDYHALEKIAAEHDFVVRSVRRAGHFVPLEGDLVRIWPPESLSEESRDALQDAFVIGLQRLHGQDIEYAINQLVEIAVRALSPGINDPFTAIACIDQLSTTLATLAEETIPEGYQYDDEGRLRVIRKQVTFGDLLDAAFHQIRQYGQNSVAVMIRLLEALVVIAGRVHTPEQREAVARHGEMIKRAYQAAIVEPNDRQDIEERYDLLMNMLYEHQET